MLKFRFDRRKTDDICRKLNGATIICLLVHIENAKHAPTIPGPVSSKSRALCGPKKPVIKLQSACFEKLIF